MKDEYIDDELLSLKLSYVYEYIDKLLDHIDELSEKTKDTLDNFDVNETFRLVHSLKGSAGTYGFKQISDIATYIENILSDIRDCKIKLTFEIVSFIIDSLTLIANIFNTVKVNYSSNKELDVDSCDFISEFKNVVYNYPDIYKLLFKQSINKSNVEVKKNLNEKQNNRIIKRYAIVIYSAKLSKEILCNVLKHYNFEVFETTSSFEALNHLLHNKCDFVFTFQVVEPFNGQSICALIKLNEKFSKIKTVFLTSNKDFNISKVLIQPDYFILIDNNLNKKIEEIINKN